LAGPYELAYTTKGPRAAIDAAMKAERAKR
jgi:hypothetical protein